MDLQTILGLIARHALTTAAGSLVAHGYLQSSGTEGFIGGGMVFAGVIWSWWQKSGQAEAAAELAAWRSRAALRQSQQGVSGGMPKAAIVAFALLAGTLLHGAPATAADFVKAPPKPSLFGGYVSGQCGMYFGLNTMGVAGAIDGGPPGASIIQGDVGVTFGFGCPIGTVPGSFWFAEGNFDIANINGSTSGLSMTGPAHFEQRFAVGGPLSSLLSLFPANPFGGLAVPSLPACPANVACGPQYPFLFVASHEQDIGAQFGIAQNREWIWSPGIGLGLESRWSNGVVADVTAQWKLDSNGLTLGPQKVKLGNAAVVGVTFKY